MLRWIFGSTGFEFVNLRATGVGGKCLVGQQPSEPSGALKEKGVH